MRSRSAALSHKTSSRPVPPDALRREFDFRPVTRLIFGNNAVKRIGELTKELGGRRVLVVTDKGIVTAGHAERVEHFLQAAGLGVVIFDGVRENPTTLDVDRCLEVARAANVDVIVGLGGGSSMDTAKGCNFLLTNGGRMRDYWGVGKARKPMLPLIAVPTTAGTGSECQSFALIADETTHQKMACGDPKAAAKIAILDPSLTLSQPARVTALTGIDAIAHAVETAVTKKRTPLSILFSREAFKLCINNLPLALENPNNLEARGNMLLGAAYAGIAIENSMLGAAHAGANPLTAHFGIAHGQAIGILLPHVIRFNAADADARRTYGELAAASGIAHLNGDSEEAVERMVSRIESILSRTRLPFRLSELSVKTSKIPMLAGEASKQWTAGFNPRTVRAREFEKLYQTAF